MKFFLCIFLVYWAFGMFALPNMNFSALQDIPEQYMHCKETEDKDLTVIDFITDHLINIDCIFDKHDNGDDQKPHKPFQYNDHPVTNIYSANQKIIYIPKLFAVANINRKFIEFQCGAVASHCVEFGHCSIKQDCAKSRRGSKIGNYG